MGGKEDRWDHGTPIRLHQVEGGPLGRRGALLRRTGPRATRENRSWISGGSLSNWNAWSRWLRSGVPTVGDGQGNGEWHYVDRGQFGWKYRGFPRMRMGAIWKPLYREPVCKLRRYCAHFAPCNKSSQAKGSFQRAGE
jgi:hypothetical protein